jgi:hypothetical protein
MQKMFPNQDGESCLSKQPQRADLNLQVINVGPQVINVKPQVINVRAQVINVN